MNNINIFDLPYELILIIYNKLNLYSKYKFIIALDNININNLYNDIFQLILNNKFKTSKYIITYDKNFIKNIFKFFYTFNINNYKFIIKDKHFKNINKIIYYYDNIFFIYFINNYIYYENDFINILSDFINQKYLDFLYNKFKNENNEILEFFHISLYKIYINKNKKKLNY